MGKKAQPEYVQMVSIFFATIVTQQCIAEIESQENDKRVSIKEDTIGS